MYAALRNADSTRVNPVGASCLLCGNVGQDVLIDRTRIPRLRCLGSWGRSVSPYTAKASVGPVRLTLAPGLLFLRSGRSGTIPPMWLHRVEQNTSAYARAQLHGDALMPTAIFREDAFD